MVETIRRWQSTWKYQSLNNIIITLSWHIGNSGMVRIVYSGIFKHIQGDSIIWNHVQEYWATLRYIEAYSGTIGEYGAIIRYVWTLRNPWIYNRAIFRTLAYLEPKNVVVQWLSLLHNFIQLSMNSGSVQIQTLLAACRSFTIVRISDNGPSWK